MTTPIPEHLRIPNQTRAEWYYAPMREQGVWRYIGRIITDMDTGERWIEK